MEKIDIQNLEKIANRPSKRDRSDSNISISKRGGKVFAVDKGDTPRGPYSITIQDGKSLEKFHIERGTLSFGSNAQDNI
jgi:hypothetical protein